MREKTKAILRQIAYEIETLDRYMAITESFLEAELKTLPPTIEQDDFHSFINYVSQKADLINAFPQILRKSAIVTLYSLTESRLNYVCDSLKEEDGLASSFHTINGAGDQSIKRARKYLVSVAKVAFPNSSEWQAITTYQKIRGFIVHNDGIIYLTKDNEEFMRNLMGKNGSLRSYIGADYVVIHLNHLFCQEAIKIVGAFFKKLEGTL